MSFVTTSSPKNVQHPRVVLMNDTSLRFHHGCARVMRLLSAGLEAQGAEIIYRSPARNDWANDDAFLAAIKQADLIVVNGEGTLHHGKEAGRVLLDIVDHPSVQNTPIALINALYEANPESWNKSLGRFSLISARDGKSAAQIDQALGTARARVVPDLSLSNGAEPQAEPRTELIVGDSVRWKRRRELALAARRLRADRFVPIKVLRQKIFSRPVIGAAARWVLFNTYNGVFFLRQPPLNMVDSEADYLAVLGHAKGHLTGRFHSICLSLVTGTPFIAVGSNSHKIETLLDDAGLGRDRIMSGAQLSDAALQDLVRPFSADELASIQEFLESAKEKNTQLFADLAELARQHVVQNK